MCGLDMEEIGRQVGQPPVEALADLLLRAKGIADEIHYGMCEEDIEYILAQPFVMIGSDGKSYPIDQPGKPHPRAYGAFARVLSHYSRQRKVISLETAVAKMTGMPANRLGLYDRGLLRPGMRADLVLVSVDAPHLFPVYNPYSALVYGANSSDVSLVMASGETLVRGGKLTRLDMREAKARLLEQMGPFMQSAAKYADII